MTESSSPRVLLILAAALALLVAPSLAAADYAVNAGQVVVVSDDIQKRTTEVVHAADATTPGSNDAGASSGGSNDSDSDSAKSGSNDSDSDSGKSSSNDSDSDSGKSNNGHGNNADGVDVSNPGKGGGGPNGVEDPSGDVDDESSGSGAAPSKGKKK